jgi:hypothetical protein
VAHRNGYEFECNVGELDDILQWSNKMGENLVAILVNEKGYRSGPLKWMCICVQYW